MVICLMYVSCLTGSVCNYKLIERTHAPRQVGKNLYRLHISKHDKSLLYSSKP